MRVGFQPIALLLVLTSTGCSAYGPGTLSRDRIDYHVAVAESTKRQSLLNIVKLRYLDPPTFVDVGQIVAGYSLETGISGTGQVAELGAGDRFVRVDGRAVFTDRPTITYSPLTGNKFIRSLMMPLAPESIFYLIESGWPADVVLFASLRSINGLKNQESTVAGTSAPDPEFLRVLAIMRRVQLSGGLALRVQQDAQKQLATFLLFRGGGTFPPEVLADVAEMKRLLHLEPDAGEFKLVFGASAANTNEIAVLTRSVLHLMSTMAAQVEVPSQHLIEHRVPPGWESAAGTDDRMRMITVHSSASCPTDAFVTVRYRDHWFWIDDRDLKSKRAFAFMTVMFTLADASEKQPLPLITVPAQ